MVRKQMTDTEGFFALFTLSNDGNPLVLLI